MTNFTHRDHANHSIRVYDNGIRVIVRRFGGGEGWTKYVVVPRQLLLDRVRSLLATGRRKNAIHWWEYFPSELLSVECYQGPGGHFVNEPFCLSSNRKHVVWCQSGGLDV